MKKEDFERLKAVCEKEGFECFEPSNVQDEPIYLIRKKKDIWEGVEFVEALVDSTYSSYSKGKIYPVKSINEKNIITSIDNKLGQNNSWGKGYFKPSTEQAYIEQLKKDAHERFGEIKEGDRFVNTKNLEIEASKRWNDEYDKDKDLFICKGVYLYQQGKWATRVKERVKITPLHTTTEKRKNDWKIDFSFSANNRNFSLNGASIFLASQLEKYLNGEIE